MYKLSIPPNQTGYSATDGSEVISTKLDGGSSRYRRDIVGATALVECTWQLGPEDFNYLRAFYNTATARGSLPFLIDLILDSADQTEHTAHFVVGSFGLKEQRGRTYIVSATLEVEPLPIDELTDVGLLIFFGTGIDSVEEAAAYFNTLEELVNTDLPDATV